MKPKLLLIAYRAYGDWLYSVPVLPYLFEKYDVYLECNYKVFSLVYNDPRFKEIKTFIYERIDRNKWKVLFPERWEKRKKEIKPDKVINLNGSLELTCITENFQEEFYWPIEDRQRYYKHRSFYEAVFNRCEVPIPKDLKLDELYYSEEEIRKTEEWRKKKQDKFIIILPIAGSTSQKVVHKFREWTYTLLDMFKEAEVYLAGDKTCEHLVPTDNPRIKNMCTGLPIKQSFLMTRYANYVLGPETGVVVSAGMWGTPKTMLCTTSSVIQCCKYHKNDYSLQAPIYCSPCHRAIYNQQDCHNMLTGETGLYYPACTKLFDLNNIIEPITKAYHRFREMGNFVLPPFQSVPSPKLSKGGGIC